jgi:phage FluMu gp28-like protein
MPPLKAAFEDDMIAIARDAEHLADLRLVKLIRGVPRIPDEREGATGKKRHGDYAVSLALAHFASRMQWREYGYEPVGNALPGVGQGSNFTGRDFMRPNHDDDFSAGGWRQPLGKRLGGSL